jgi:hypothetical protein
MFCETRQGVELVSVAADGVGCDNKWICSQLMEYLSGNLRHVGLIDTNHNMKNFRYQFLGGSSVVWMGRFILDTELFRISGVATLFWRVKDFASDLLVLKLASVETVLKLYKSMTEKSEDHGSVGILCVTLYFI